MREGELASLTRGNLLRSGQHHTVRESDLITALGAIRSISSHHEFNTPARNAMKKVSPTGTLYRPSIVRAAGHRLEEQSKSTLTSRRKEFANNWNFVPRAEIVMPETTISVPSWLCLLCGHKWPIKSSGAPPEKCAKCHKRDWNGSRTVSRGNRYTAQWSHQKKVRVAQARHTPPTPEQIAAGSSLQNATVREVTRKDVVDLIRRQEYLGTLGSGRYYYALHFNYNGKEHLGGACIFGDVAGTSVNQICGSEHANEVICLIRGCCAGGWTHPHSASFMISRAIKLIMKDHGKHIIRAFCDPAALEEGVIYKSLNFLYLGWTNPTTEYHVDGRCTLCSSFASRGGTSVVLLASKAGPESSEGGGQESGSTRCLFVELGNPSPGM